MESGVRPGTGSAVGHEDKYLRKLGLASMGKRSFYPVEKLVELKTTFEIPFGKDRSVGFKGECFGAIKP